MEHYYETIGENWFSYAEFYKDIVDQLSDDALIVEVGCWKGRSTCCLGVEILNSKKNINLFCVDSWKYIPSTEQPISSQEEFDKVYFEFLDNIKPFASLTTIIREDSNKAAKSFADESLDFIFVDANHTYESVKDDVYAWIPKLKKGGIIAGHDYFTRVHPGVKQAIDEIFKENVSFIPEQNVWIFIE
jgi:hypothetical protein